MIESYRSAFLALALVFGALATSAAQTSSPLESEIEQRQERGRQIYLTGKSNGSEIKAVLGTGDGELSATLFSCVNCHGPKGAGTTEGGLRPPPITWVSLSSRNRSAMSGRLRDPYDQSSLQRAITVGIDPGGRRLHPGMPRYKLTRSQSSDLLAYLQILGRDTLDAEPGLSDEAIKLGVTLPMTGPIAGIGKDISGVLSSYFAEVNSQGGVYGRRLELAIADSQGDLTKTAEATRRLVEQDGVFALIGSFEPGNNRVNDGLIQKSNVPLIGPISFSPRDSFKTNRQTFYLLPGFFDQARSLVDFLLSRKDVKVTATKLAAVCSNGGFEEEALAGLTTQANVRGLELPVVHRFVEGKIDASAVVSLLSQKPPAFLFFFGKGEDFLSLKHEMVLRSVDIPLLSCASLIGDAAFQLPGGGSASFYLSYPSLLPGDNEFKEFLDLMRTARVPLRSVPLQALAYAAAKVFVEAARQTGRQLSRSGLIDSLEKLREFRTGVLPPISFGPNRRVGATESLIVSLDVAGKQFVSVSNQR